MSQRLNRMSDQVQREIADLIRTEIKDPRLNGLITVSATKVSPDLGYADIYVTVMPAGQLNDLEQKDLQENTLKILNGAASYLRGELGRRIKTRVTPRLRFHYDNATAHGNYMAGLIAKAVSETGVSDETLPPSV